jgi:hypothetical protein
MIFAQFCSITFPINKRLTKRRTNPKGITQVHADAIADETSAAKINNVEVVELFY